MTLNPAQWLRQTKAVYFDNATSVRDYRVQLRGNRSVILFGVYLATLIAVASVVYSNSAQGAQVEVVQAQAQLRNFYNTIMSLLGGLVSLIAPALTATTVVTERQRRSFDLIFSAPVTPKYFLVGKMISSFRYTWMLLVLALPVTAACVVLGGATWQDVLVSYLLLSLNGLMLTAIALLMSTVALKPVSAVLWSYAANVAFLILTGMLSAGGLARGFMGGPMHNQEAPFFATLNPFLVQFSAGTYTTIGMTQVPNWVFTIAMAALVSKLCLLAAGTLLSPRPQKEIRSLRVHALVYLCSFILYTTWIMASVPPLAGLSDEAGRWLFSSLMPLCVFMPFLSTYGVDSERRYWPDGAFSLRKVLDGSPSGGLPYVYLVILSSAAMVWAGFHFGGSKDVTSEFGLWLIYLVGFWTFFWSIGQYASSLFVGLRSARTIQFAAFLLVVVLPLPFLASMTDSPVSGVTGPSLWDFYILRPSIIEHANGAPAGAAWGILLLGIGVITAFFANRNTRRKMELIRSRYE